MEHLDEYESMGKKSDIRIDFINFVESPDESISYPMGILYLSAYLKKHDFTNIGFTEHVCLLRKLAEKENNQPDISFFPKQYFLNIREENYEKIITYLEERRPHIILLGPITTYHLVELVYLSKKLRQHFSEQVFISGGPHFGEESHLDIELLEISPELDGIVIGEAEETIIEVISQFYSKYVNKGAVPTRREFLSDLAKIPGVLTQVNDLQLRNPPSLENMLPPDIGLLEEYWNSPHVTMQYSYSLSQRRNPIIYTDMGYFQGEADWGIIIDDVHRFSSFKSRLSRFPFVVIIGSRGCPYNCAFCCSPGYRRVHSAQYIIDLIHDMNQRYETSTFVFFESLFTTASPKEQRRVMDICNMLINSNLNIEYIIDIRADVVSELPDYLLASLIQSGCVQFNLGLEKGTNLALDKIRKGTRIEHHFEAVKKLRRAAKKVGKEIIVNGTFILGGPGELKADIRDTIIHSWYLHLDEVTFYIMQIYPGTQVYNEAIKEGIIKPDLSPYLNIEKFPLYATDDISLPYMNRIKKLNDNTIRALGEFKKSVKELEYQLVPEEMRVPSNIILDETRDLYESFCDFIDAALDFVRKSDDRLFVDGEINAALQDRVLKIIDEIHRAEERLLLQYPNYDPYVSGYHIGTVTYLLKQFIKIFNELLKKFSYS